MLSVNVPVADGFHSCRLAGPATIDEGGFITTAVDDGSEILKKRETEERRYRSEAKEASPI